ncbi:MAG: oligosaccharide flippase family protein [Bacteroidales bacterium]|nr:oligosaccharide flippase family protein [Bacteroidales bacterium]
MISRSFFKSSLIYSIIGALPYASGFLLLPWFTAYLTPQQFGVNAMYIALMYLIQIISSYGMDMSAGVMYFDYKDDKQKVREFIGTVFIGVAMLGAITFMIFSLGGLRLFNFVFKTGDFIEFLPFGLFTIISGVFNSIFKTYSSLLINQQRPVRFFWLNISNFVLTIGGSLALLYLFPYTLYGPILGRLIPAVLVASVSLTLVGREYGLSWNPVYLSKIVSYSSPIIIYALLTWVVSYVDRFLIARMLGDTTYVGIYDIAVKLVIGLDLVMTGLINTVNPKIYGIWKDKNLNESNTEINRYYNGITALFLFIIPLFVLIVPVIIPLVVYKPIYYQAFGFLAILAAGYATRVWFYMFLAPLMYFKRTAALPRVFIISAIFNVVAGIILIHYFGIIGAVWTNFMVKPLQALLMYLESRKVYSFKLNAWKIFYTPIIYIAVVIVTEIFTPAELKFIAQIGQFILALILIYFAYRKEVIPIVRKFIGR